mgnify:CR=1 FL=1
MENLFVSYEVAKKLKEKGFDEGCLAWYDSFDNKLHTWRVGDALVHPMYIPDSIVAPIHKQVIDWFLDKHFILICQEEGAHNLGAWAAFRFVSLGAEPEIIILRQENISTVIEEALKLI